MSSVTTFGAFTTARLGIYAAQKGLDVTGQNISNINTTGYTRETLDQVSLRTGGTDFYTSAYNAGVGSGVLVTGISQIRDPYLDIRFRTEQASVGAMDTKLAGLEELSGVLDEVADGDGNGILEAQFNDLVDQLQTMSNDHATEEEYDSLVRSSADSLVKLFNNYADRLQTIRENQEESLDQDVDDINGIFKSIQGLNDQITKSQVHGDDALELQDQRNLLIDQLSGYLKIDVTYQPVSVGAGSSVDKMIIRTAGDNPQTLVDGGYTTELSVSDDGSYTIGMSALTNAKGVTLAGSVDSVFGDTELYGSLQSSRELLTEKGEFSSASEAAADPAATTKRGIPYYQTVLDALAQKFASVLNEANTGCLKNSDGEYVDSTGTVVSGADDAEAIANGAVALGGPLFSNSSNTDDTDHITAANLSISKSWSTGSIGIQNSMVESASSPGEVNSSDNSNILHIIVLLDGSQSYQPSDAVSYDPADPAFSDDPYFEGSFQQMLTNIQSTLAQDVSNTTTLLDNYSSAATQLDTNRDSVSGVDLNDEAMGLMQYQKSYSAACRLMTTLDEALDKLINDTGVVGR